MKTQIFISYSHKDRAWLELLQMHLSPLKHQGFIDVWSDHDIDVGTEWKHEIDKHLNEAHIILLLISPDFMASEYHSSYVKRAIERSVGYDTQQGLGKNTNSVLIFPILLRPIYWEDTLLSRLDILPRNHIPIIECPDQDEAFCDIAKEIRYIVEITLTNTWQDEANKLYREGKYNEALAVYEKMLQLKNTHAASVCKGNVLSTLQRYEEALYAYNQDLHSKRDLSRKKAPIGSSPTANRWFYEEALQIYEQIFQQSPSHSSRSSWFGMTLEDMPTRITGESWSAIDRLNEAIQHSPINPFLYHLKGNMLFQLEQYRVALGAYEQAIQLQGRFELSQKYLSQTIEKIRQEEYEKLNNLARHDLETANQIRDSRHRDANTTSAPQIGDNLQSP